MYKILRYVLLSAYLLTASGLHASPAVREIVEIKLGDYRYMPATVELKVGQPVTLRLVNSDSLTPHNFTLEDADGGFNVDVDVAGGDSVDVELKPLRPGSYTFYCKNKLLFMDSHRQKGMQGALIVVSDRLAQ